MEDRLTSSDVVAFYRVFLGREPESDDVVQNHLEKYKNLSSFVVKALETPEFYKRNSKLLARTIFSKAPMPSVGDIEVDCSEDELFSLLSHVKRVWSKLGEIQPHYSVLSTADYRPERIAQNSKSFYDSGEVEWRTVVERLQSNGLELSNVGRAIELGCGVGRVTKAMSGAFKQVEGYDVSEPHLRLARDYINRATVSNVKFVRIDNAKNAQFSAHDFFYSRLTLQHNPPPVILFVLRKIFEKTNDNGLVMFQLPTAKRNYRFSLKSYLEQKDSIEDQEVHVVPQALVLETMIRMGISPIEIYRDGSLTGFDTVSTTFIGKKQFDAIHRL